MNFKWSRDRKKIMGDREEGQEAKQGQRKQDINLIEMESH